MKTYHRPGGGARHGWGANGRGRRGRVRRAVRWTRCDALRRSAPAPDGRVANDANDGSRTHLCDLRPAVLHAAKDRRHVRGGAVEAELHSGDGVAQAPRGAGIVADRCDPLEGGAARAGGDQPVREPEAREGPRAVHREVVHEHAARAAAGLRSGAVGARRVWCGRRGRWRRGAGARPQSPWGRRSPGGGVERGRVARNAGGLAPRQTQRRRAERSGASPGSPLAPRVVSRHTRATWTGRLETRRRAAALRQGLRGEWS